MGVAQRSSTFISCSVLLVLILLTGCDPTKLFDGDGDGEKVTAIFVFGDSISDTGNVFLATNRDIPVSPPYFAGRFSNGRIWVERLAEAFDLDVDPILARGTNFAVGGARASRDVEVVLGQETFTIPSLLSQVDLFFGSRVDSFFEKFLDFFVDREKADPDALYIILIGGDDIRDVVFGLDGGFGEQETIDAVIANISMAIRKLADAGSRMFLIPNVPDVGLSPETTAAGPNAVMLGTNLSERLNNALRMTLDNLEAELGLTIFRLDTFALLEDIVADPRAFGLTNVTDPCLEGPTPEFVGGIPCANPNEHLFWDNMHATASGHAILADAALAALPLLQTGTAGTGR